MDNDYDKMIDKMNESNKKYLYNYIKRKLNQDKKKKLPTYTCSICGLIFKGYGNNAQPINNGRCCDECNKKVIEERIKRFKENKEEVENNG